ncbi:hypothetical protein LGAA44_20010 [Leuconostoc gasicomitatum]|nr:hypothetical protein LGAA44_20010 [Leuconostoc gasicomitatum]
MKNYKQLTVECTTEMDSRALSMDVQLTGEQLSEQLETIQQQIG